MPADSMQIVTFASGSSGNCTLVSFDGRCFLIDAGISFKRIRENLALSGVQPDQLSAVLITHEHSDHISGLATMVKRCPAPVFATPVVAQMLRKSVPGIAERLRELPIGETANINGVSFRAFRTPHDTRESVGWRLQGEEESFALATDMGRVTEDIREGLTGADAVLIEANHDLEMLRYGPYPYPLKKRIMSEHGHLSNLDCASLACDLSDSGVRCIILGHLSRENNSPALAFQTVSAALAGKNTQLYVAPALTRLTLELERRTPCLA